MARVVFAESTLDFPASVVEKVAIGDFDADGRKDVVFAEQSPCRIRVLRRMPGGAFTELGPFLLPWPAPANSTTSCTT